LHEKRVVASPGGWQTWTVWALTFLYELLKDHPGANRANSLTQSLTPSCGLRRRSGRDSAPTRSASMPGASSLPNWTKSVPGPRFAPPFPFLTSTRGVTMALGRRERHLGVLSG